MLFKDNSYPGRGIVLGLSSSGDYSVAAYFIMGRSIKSRSRRFSEEPDGISIGILDESYSGDALIDYHPVRKAGDILIVTNGVQTDAIARRVADDYGSGGPDLFVSFREALSEFTYEPDEPHFTPRISGMIEPDGRHILGILSRYEREFYEYEPMAGIGHMIHTYTGDKDPLPSYRGVPQAIALPDTADELAETLWECLDPEHRISLYVRYKSIKDTEENEIIYNKY